VSAVDAGQPLKIISFSIFGFTLVLLYAASTLYHALRPLSAKRVFHIFDHSAIFLLIAGTYTPVTLVAIGGTFGWSLFGIVWGLAIAGILATAIFFERARYFNLALYIVMGWLVVITGPGLLRAFSQEAIFWLIAGGLLYTGGVFFYRAKTLRFGHMVWHLFVLGGSVCHFFLMLQI